MMCGAQIMIHINISSLFSNIKNLLWADISIRCLIWYLFFLPPFSSCYFFRPKCFELTDHLPGPGGKLNKIRVSSIWALVISLMMNKTRSHQSGEASWTVGTNFIVRANEAPLAARCPDHSSQSHPTLWHDHPETAAWRICSYAMSSVSLSLKWYFWVILSNPIIQFSLAMFTLLG